MIEKNKSVSETPEQLADPSDSFDEVTQEAPVKHRSVARSAGIVSVAVMFSRVLGLIRETIFAKYFGAGFLYDAFLVGFRVPNLLRDLFAEGALSAAFVKVFTDYQLKKNEAEAWRLASMVFNGLAVVLSVITIAGIILSPLIVSAITYNYLGDPNHYYPPEKAALATTLMQIMFPFILLVALAALAMGVLNTKGRFGIPASASTAFNIVSIIFGLGFAFWLSGGGWEYSNEKNLIPGESAQWAIIGMSIGVLIGGAAQLLIQIPSLLKVGFRFSLSLNFADEGVRRIMRLMGPAIIGTSAIQVKVLVDTVVASGIEGGASWLSYAFRLMQFPIGVFGVAIGTAAIPALSRLASENNFDKFRSTLSGAIKLVFLLAIPSACGLIVLGEPIISLIYERGEFDRFDTNMTAWALTAYAVGLAGYAAIKVLSPSFYALDDAKTPMYVSLASIIVHVALSFGLMKFLSTVGVSPERPNGFGHVGVALATSIVAIANFIALAVLMRKRINGLNGREILIALIKIAIASAALSAVCYLSYRFLSAYFPQKDFVIRLIEAFIPIGLGGITFIIAAKFLRIEELEKVYKAVSAKLGRAK
ncbi:MAG: murein biosynthesis integral membrane protein MurJ [Acidobacteriota bacterium]|nr:murein biosynthesis integral membrane protein MurJ [Blastocatellia bacterium]MDQ3220765.1 murein biosynthesis integral membrane protein MurJ [Acidobacteriota bacterium]MDQ3491292.1 murein biosynthesis integral membrane protein MurJ [Acidobacteriota bacterium]